MDSIIWMVTASMQLVDVEFAAAAFRVWDEFLLADWCCVISYFTEDGTMRQLKLLIGQLPVIPRNEAFRERYMPLLWNRRWN